MAIEPTSLGDLMTMPDVALDPGNRASGQDFAEFSDVLALSGLTVVGVSTVDVGNPTPEAVVIDAPVAVDPEAELKPEVSGVPLENPLQTLTLIAEKLGVIGKAGAKQDGSETGEIPSGVNAMAAKPGLIDQATPEDAEGHFGVSHDKVESADKPVDPLAPQPQPMAQTADVAAIVAAPVPAHAPIAAGSTGNPAPDEAAKVLAAPPLPETAILPIVDQGAKPKTSEDRAASGGTANPLPPVAPGDPAIPANKMEIPSKGETAGSDGNPESFQLPPQIAAPQTPGLATALDHAATMAGPAPAAAPAPPVHQQVLEDLLIGNSVEDQWIDRLAHDVEMLISSDNREARLHLRPRELGDLSIRLEMRDGQAKVHFTVETAAAQSFITDATPRLQTMMENRGFKLEQASVDVGANGGGKGGTGENGRQDAQPFVSRSTPPSMLAAAASRVAKLTAFERYA